MEMINQNKIDLMEAVGDLLHQAVASGQVTAEQIEEHQKAGELGKSAIRMAVESAHFDFVQSQSTNNRSEAVFRLINKVQPLLAEHDLAIKSLQDAKDARLAFISNQPARYVEHAKNGMYRVYQDHAAQYDEVALWVAMTTGYYGTAAEAVDAAIASQKGEV